MAEGEYPSTLSAAAVAAMHASLVADWRVAECKMAAAANRRADIGLFIRSNGKFFYAADQKPVVKGFTPGNILEGDWSAPKVLTPADAAANQHSVRGFVTACSVDLGKIPDIDQFLLDLLKQFGPVTIAPQFSPNLMRSVPFMRADQATLAAAPVSTAYDGRGSTICVIDMGCDYSHRNFRKGAGLAQSRLSFLGVMNEDGSATQYTNATINTWIAGTATSPYDPHKEDYNCIANPQTYGTHGTLVLDIAGGNGNGTGVKGVAPAADLVFMQVFVSKVDPMTPGGGRRYVGGDAILNAILKAREWLALDTAGSPPTVFNVSMGTNDGPHDSIDHGGTAWNVQLNQVFAGKKGRALVWSAGNQFRSNLHVSGVITRITDGGGNVAYTEATMDVRVPAGDKRLNTVWFWVAKPAAVTLSVKAQLQNFKGASSYTPWLQYTGTLKDGKTSGTGRAAGTIGAEAQYGTGNLYRVQVDLLPPLARTGSSPADEKRWEVWRLMLTGNSANDYSLPFHAWIERDDGDQIFFEKAVTSCKIDPLYTLNTGAAGVASAIVVGAVGTATYLPGTPVNSPGVGATMPFSSAGPTRDGVKRPDVCAPGEIIAGAKSLGDPVANGTLYGGKAELTAMSGTSMAAPHVSGLVALLFDKLTRSSGIYPDSDGVRALLIGAARLNIPGSTTPQWEPQRGWGAVDAVELLD